MITGIKALVDSSNNRPSWDEYHMAAAFLMSSRSPSNKKKVGAVIVQNKRIISSGYNGFPAGMDQVSIFVNKKEINTIHAEQNAIADAARRGIAVEGTTLYSTHEPCINCTKFIIAAGISSVKYYHKYESATDDLTDEARRQLFLGSDVKLSSVVPISPLVNKPSTNLNNLAEAKLPDTPIPQLPDTPIPQLPVVCACEGCPSAKKIKCETCEHAKVCPSAHKCSKHSTE